MIWALFNDIAQRIITLDKYEQRNNLSLRLRRIGLPSGSKVLDFGCGTGLFARVFVKERFLYLGFDIDDRLINYAGRLYRNCQFTSSTKTLEKEAPFDLIVANCCFHHINDTSLPLELERIDCLLADNGLFILIDLLKVEDSHSLLHRLFMMMEQGAYLRTSKGYKKHIERFFQIRNINIERLYALGLRHRLNPLYNDLAVFECNSKES